jgi:hypothetical protein
VEWYKVPLDFNMTSDIVQAYNKEMKEVKGFMVRKLVVDVPDDLKAQFKTFCMKHGSSIHSQIIEFMQATLDGTEEPNGIESVENAEISSVAAPAQLKKAMDFDVKAFRNALNLKEQKKEQISDDYDINDPLNIGL